MKSGRIDVRCFFWLLAVVFVCTACVSPRIAATIALTKAEGEVEIIDRRGKDVSPKENLRLFDGYTMATNELSYAWMDLDSARLVKMDQESQIEILKERKKLEIVVQSGSLFFHIAKPLEEDESLDIRTSSMMVGIRGTCGWVEVFSDEGMMRVYLLEGKVECRTKDKQEMVQAGEMAVLTEDGEVHVSEFTVQDIPAFVMEEMQEDDELLEAVEEEPDLPQEDSVLPSDEDEFNIPEQDVQNSQEVTDALEQYRNIIQNIKDGQFSYAEPAEIIKYSLIKMQREDRVPTLLLCSEERNGAEYVYVSRYDPVSRTVQQANEILSQGVVFSGNLRDELCLDAGGDGILYKHWLSGGTQVSIERVTMEGNAFDYAKQWEGYVDAGEPEEFIGKAIAWYDIDRLEWMENWKFDDADPYSETQDLPETTVSETREEPAGSSDNHDFGTPGNRPYT